MFRLLRQVSLRHVRASWGRTALVVSGVAVGVALIVAIDIINASVLQNVRQTIETLAGPAALEVTLGLGEIGFPESTVDIVRTDPGVAAAVPLVRGTVSLADDPGETVQLFGADLTAEEDLARYPITTTDRESVLRGLEDPRSILLAESFADRHHVRVGRTIDLATPEGVQAFTVRGLLRETGIARTLGGQLALMDLPAAQLLLGKPEKIDQIDVVLREGTDTAVAQQRLQAALPPMLAVGRPQQRGEHYERVLAGFQGMLGGLSTLCLIAGVFIIYNANATDAVRRAGVMAELRLLGAEHVTLLKLLMTEATILATTGAIFGIGYGIVLARALMGMVSDSIGVIFQLRLPVDELTVPVLAELRICALGITTGLFASYSAARRSSRVEPLVLIRSGAETGSSGNSPVRLAAWWSGLVAISAAAIVMEVRQKSFAWGNFGSTLWNASVPVIAVPLVALSATALTRLLTGLFRTEGRVAVESLLRARTRVGVTVAAVALVLAIGITLSTLSRSFRRSVASYYEEGFNVGDLVVSAVTTEGGWLETPLPDALAARLQEIPGVIGVETLRFVVGQLYRNERIALLALSDGVLDPSRFGSRWYQEGDPAHAAESIRARRGVNVSVALSDRFGLHVGDSLDLDTPTGRLTVPIVGVIRDYSSDRGVVMLSRRLLAERWSDSTVNRFHVLAEPGVRVDAVRERISKSFGERFRLKILSLREMVQYQSASIDRAFAFTNAMQLLIVIVTVAGIFDLLVAAILERRRELALWRLIGAEERSVRRSVVIESATIGSLGMMLGLAVGVVTAWLWVRFNMPYLIGFTLDYHFAAAAAAWYSVLAISMAMVGGYGAAYHATRQSVLENLRVDVGATG